MAAIQSPVWEHTLLSFAHEARPSALMFLPKPAADERLLDRAYAHCDAMTAAHSRSFYMASGLLPAAKRRAVRALYAFCRTTDDIVDCCDCDARASLAAWRIKAMSSQPSPNDLVAIAWAAARSQYHIPPRYAEQLIDGVARDLVQKRYQTFDELAAYAYGVASTVGLMSMHIIGFAGPEAIPYAIKLGVALQITNILRDVGEDWHSGRMYLPAQELTAFGLTEWDIAIGKTDRRWRDFMRFQIDRNRRLYDEARPGIALLNRDGRFAVAAAGELYRAILADIEAHNYDVFTRRAHVSGLRKLSQLPSIWWHTR